MVVPLLSHPSWKDLSLEEASSSHHPERTLKGGGMAGELLGLQGGPPLAGQIPPRWPRVHLQPGVVSLAGLAVFNVLHAARWLQGGPPVLTFNFSVL